MSRIDYRTAKRSVFAAYWMITVWTLGGLLTFWLTILFGRSLLTSLHQLSTEGVVMLAHAIYHDIWLVPAFVICGLLVWSIPWETIFAGTCPSPFQILRGRQIEDQRTAKVLAYNQIANSRAARQRKLIEERLKSNKKTASPKHTRKTIFGKTIRRRRQVKTALHQRRAK